MKILGFHMDCQPTVGAHVQALRKRYWILYHLRRYGFTEEELCKVYQTIIRPVADYCCVVYHSMLSDEQDELLYRCQAQALRCIFGKDVTYQEIRRRAGVPTLRQRRIKLCDKFVHKCLNTPRFLGWFPRKKAPRNTRTSQEFVKFFARCDCLKNSPLYYMRCRLNGKEGKAYGERYKHRRSITN